MLRRQHTVELLLQIMLLILLLPLEVNGFGGMTVSLLQTRNVQPPLTLDLFKRRTSSEPYQAAVRTTNDSSYDWIIIGAGASGLFASGAATGLGARKVLLIDQTDDQEQAGGGLGGDCTNGACVPSKALRSMARLVSMTSPTTGGQDENDAGDFLGVNNPWMRARNQMDSTIQAVKTREDPTVMVKRRPAANSTDNTTTSLSPSLDIAICSECHFVSSYQLNLTIAEFYTDASTPPTETTTDLPIIVTGKRFLIATGASPVRNRIIEDSAKAAGVPVFDYQTLLRRKNRSTPEPSIWELFQEDAIRNNTTRTASSDHRRIVFVGGGATACELAQSLARLGQAAEGPCQVELIAPTLLPGEDAKLKTAAAQLLAKEHVLLHLGRRLLFVSETGRLHLDDGTYLPAPRALVLCLGRRPTSLKSFQLHKANIEWDETRGVLVRPATLRSITARHVFASGDCCSAVTNKPATRTATHAAWTGYFAVVKGQLPRWLTIGSRATHQTIPRVIYTDPELVSVGLLHQECVEKFGSSGFDELYAPEEQTDRADMESKERATIGFVELRASKVDGRILGLTACGPMASELANSMSIAINNRLTTRDIARSLHSYPSHGYLLYRVALSLALSSLWGSVEACGPVGAAISKVGRTGTKVAAIPRKILRSIKGKHRHGWEMLGSRNMVLLKSVKEPTKIRYASFQDIHRDAELQRTLLLLPKAKEEREPSGFIPTNVTDIERLQAWLDDGPT